MQRKELSGTRINNLLVVKYHHTNHKTKRRMWLCKCKCGEYTLLPTTELRKDRTQSCGCLRKAGIANYRHGAAKTPEYNIWSSMKQRCLNKKCKDYPLYGGRGIEVCYPWKVSYQEFIRDMGHRPSESHSLDRVNNDGNYNPTNCRWATPKEQSQNRRCVYERKSSI